MTGGTWTEQHVCARDEKKNRNQLILELGGLTAQLPVATPSLGVSLTVSAAHKLFWTQP